MTATPAIVASGNSDTDATSYTTGSITFVAGRDYLIAFEFSRSGAAPATAVTISGATSGTWTAVSAISFNTVASNRSRVISRRFRATSSFSEAITLDLGGVTHTGAKWICVEVPECSPTTPLAQSTSNRGNAGTSGSLTFGASQIHPLNPRVAFVAVDIGGSPVSAGGSYTLLGQVSGTTPAESLACITYTGDENPSATFSSADWAMIGSEFSAILTGSGAVEVPVTVDGAGDVASSGTTGTGDVAVPITLAGVGGLTFLGGGGVAVPLQLAGAGGQTFQGPGGVTVPVQLAGTGVLSMQGTGAVTLTPSLAGSGLILMTGTGAVTLTPGLAGAGTVSSPGGGVSGAGSVTVPVVLAGAGLETMTGAGGVTVAPGLAGAGLETFTGAGAVTLPVPGLAGTGQERFTGSGALTLQPVLGGSGLVITAIAGSGGAVVAFALAGVGTVTIATSRRGKYATEHAGARGDLGAATGFAGEHAGALADLGEAGQ